MMSSKALLNTAVLRGALSSTASRAASATGSLTKTLLVLASVFSLMIPQAHAGEPVLGDAPPATRQAHAGRALGRILAPTGMRLSLESVDLNGLREKIEKAAVQKPTEAAVGVGQTLVVMMTLAGVEMTAQEVKKNGGHAPSPKKLAEIAGLVAMATINSPAIWTSILTSSGFSLANKPAVALGQVLLQPKLRAAFGPLLARSITSTIAFVGWDFGSQLWTEASLLLKSKEDYQIATNTFGMSKGVLTAALAAQTHGQVSIMDQQRARVAKEMMRNMLMVLMASDLRAQLFYNFMRNDILTGEFQTMLASFIACGAIGTAIFPGAGTLAGLIFGAIGIVVAQFIPQEQKDQITNGWQFVRRKALDVGISISNSTLAGDLLPGSLWQYGFSRLAGHIRDRHILRSHWVTIQWEEMYIEARANKVDLSKTFPAHFEKVRQFYVNELAEMKAFEATYSIAMERADVTKLMNGEIARVSAMIEFFDALKTAAAADPRNDQILQTIEASKSRGFDETTAVNAWNQGA